MNERSLSRRLSTSVVETLKSAGHILVVKGGMAALTRELDELMAPMLATIAPRLEPRAVVGGEVTSTFGDEAADEAVEEMVAEMTHALMDSDHVEDVFAEDNVIRRDIFRTVRDGLLHPSSAIDVGEGDDDQEPSVRVRLDTLGYVASTVSKRTDATSLQKALERAAKIAQASLLSYDADAREAAFTVDTDSPDARLELEEAIADELADLVDQGLADLPTIERRVDLGQKLGTAEMRAAQPKVDRIGERTLLATGCAATWDFVDSSTLRVTFTPLSDQDAREVDRHMMGFGRDVVAAVTESKVKVAPPPESQPEINETEEEEEPAEVDEEPLAEVPAAPPKRTKPSAKKAAPKKSPAKKAAPAKKAEPVKKQPTKKAVTKKATKSKAAAKKR